MGMFDKPQFLTGKNGLIEPGQTFWLHAAKVDGKSTVNGQERDQVKLRISLTRDGEKIDTFTAGVGIVNQVRRMSDDDRRSLPLEVRLDEVPSQKGSPTRVLTPASSPAPSLDAADVGSGEDTF